MDQSDSRGCPGPVSLPEIACAILAPAGITQAFEIHSKAPGIGPPGYQGPRV